MAPIHWSRRTSFLVSNLPSNAEKETYRFHFFRMPTMLTFVQSASAGVMKGIRRSLSRCSARCSAVSTTFRC